jgi:hypothetical protein
VSLSTINGGKSSALFGVVLVLRAARSLACVSVV